MNAAAIVLFATINTITPSQGPIAGGTIVTISGANFTGVPITPDGNAVRRTRRSPRPRAARRSVPPSAIPRRPSASICDAELRRTPNCVAGTYSVTAPPLSSQSTASVAFANDGRCHHRAARH